MIHAVGRPLGRRLMRRATTALGVTAVVAAVAACGSSGGGGGGSAGGGGGSKGPIKVGIVFDQTGPEASFGQGYLNATKLAFDQANATGGINGHKIEYTVVDSASDPGTGVNVTRKLLDQDGIKLIFGGEYDPISLAIANLATSQHALFFSPASSSPDLTHPVRPLVYNVLPDANVQNAAIVPFLKSLGVTRIGTVVETDTFGTTHNAQLIASLPKKIKVVKSETISPSATSAATQILALQSAHVQAVVWEGAAVTVSNAIVQAVHQYSLNVPVVTFGAGTSPATDQLLTQVPVSYYSVTPLACALTMPCAKSFASAYKPRFGASTLITWTAQGYGAAEAFVDALKKSNGYSPTDVAAALDKLNYSSPLIPTPIKFSSTNHMGGNLMYLQGYKDKKLYYFGTNIHDNKFQG
jgi:branched-chain amino acid transport system substrate-binding protein